MQLQRDGIWGRSQLEAYLGRWNVPDGSLFVCHRSGGGWKSQCSWDAAMTVSAFLVVLSGPPYFSGLCKVSPLDNWLLIWWVKMQSRSCQAFLGHVPRIGTASFLPCSVGLSKSQASPEVVPESLHKNMSQEAIFRAKLPQCINVVNYIN